MMLSRRQEVQQIADRIVSSYGEKGITEIYIMKGSAMKDNLKGTVNLMVVTDPTMLSPKTPQTDDFYNFLNDIEEEQHSFALLISVEPDAVERGHGDLLWKR